MIAVWMLRVAVASGLIAVGSWLVERALGARGRGRRHAWVAGLVAALVLPVLSWFAPRLMMESEVFRLVADGLGTANATRVVRSVVSEGAASIAGDGVALLTWLALAVVAAAVYAGGWWRVRRARRGWRAGCLAGRSVLVSAGVGPAAVGLLNPAIVVPEWLLASDERLQRLVVLHESEHVAAGDHLLLALAPLAIVLAPWNVALWLMVWRLRIAVEVDCDRRVLRRGVPAADYGALLIDVAGRALAIGYGLAFATRRTNLERRLLALTATSPRRAGFAAALNGSAALLVVLLACAAAVPASRGLDDLVLLPPGLAGETTTYEVDGVPVTEAEARSLSQSSGDRVEVVRQRRIALGDGGVEDGAMRTIRIFTKPGKGLERAAGAGGPAGSISATIDQVRDRLRGSGSLVWIDEQRSTFEGFDSLSAERTASIVVRQRGPAARPEIRITTRSAGRRPGAGPHRTREEP